MQPDSSKPRRHYTLPTTLAERFWAKVDTGGPTPSHLPHLGPCWLWTAARFPGGYGKIGDRPGHTDGAHRVSWRLHFGPIPNGLHVLHACDNPPCCNPAHLWLGTNRDNAADMMAKGRWRRGQRNPRRGEDSPNVKLTTFAVLTIRAEWEHGARGIDLAARYGVSRASVSLIVHRKNWRHL